MAEFKTLDTRSFAEAGARGAGRGAAPRALTARLHRRSGRVMIKLDTGLEVTFDPSIIPDLVGAQPHDLGAVSIEGVGSTLRFPRLDVDITVSRLLETFLAPLDRATNGDPPGDPAVRRVAAG